MNEQLTYWGYLLLATVASVAFLIVMFRPLELAFPARRGQRMFRPNWGVDLLFLAGQYLVWNAVVFWVLVRFSGRLEHVVPGGLRAAIAAQPWWLQTIEIILLSDVCIYWAHRLQHNVGFLWRFHRVHHTAEHLDWLAAHREHPLDTIYTVGIINLPAFLLGYQLEPIAGFIAFRGIWAIYIHSNVRMPTGPLRVLFGAPELHHWHHDRDRFAGNYANISPLMDVIFGTYRCPAHEPESFGITEYTPRGYFAQLLYPLVPSKWWRRRNTPEAIASATPTSTSVAVASDSRVATRPRSSSVTDACVDPLGAAGLPDAPPEQARGSAHVIRVSVS